MIVGTHGWCVRNPNGATGWSYAMEGQVWASGGLVRGSTVVGELMSVLMLLRAYPDLDMTIQSSSSYLVGACSLWKDSWQHKGYIKGDGQRLSNLKFIIPIHHLLDTSPAEIEFVKVPDKGDIERFPLHSLAAQRARKAAFKAQNNGVEVFMSSSD